MKDPLGQDLNGVPQAQATEANGHASTIPHNGHTPSNGNMTVNGSSPLDSQQAEAGPSGTAVVPVDRDAPVWPAFGAKYARNEVVRILVQALQEIGYPDVATTLERESGFSLDPAGDVTDFRRGILNGDWATVERLLEREARALETRGPGQGSLHIMSIEQLKEAKFLVAQQKYLELLESGNQQRALAVLRTEVHPLASTVSKSSPSLSTSSRAMGSALSDEHAAFERLGLLSSLLCSGPDSLYARSGWAGVGAGTRIRLLDDMKDLIPPSYMLPPHRLANLFTQAHNLQCLSCLYHVSNKSLSLLRDHHCPRSAFPSITTQILQAHTDEVWRLEWSRNGKLLASGGKDKKAVVWRCFDGMSSATATLSGGTGAVTFRVEHVFDGHESGVSALCWDHASEHLVTASDCQIRIFDVARWVCISAVVKHDYEVSVLATLADGSSFISGAMDQTIHCWKFSGDHLWTWCVPLRVLDLAPTPDGRYLLGIGFAWETRQASGGADSEDSSSRQYNGVGAVATTTSTTSAVSAVTASGNSAGAASGSGAGLSVQSLSGAVTEKVQKLLVGDLTNRTTRTIELRRDVTCVRVSNDSKHALVNFAPDEIGLYSIDSMRLIQTYTGQRQVNGNIIQSCFGGSDQGCVLSGSEDGNVYAWHKHSGERIGVFSGHEPDTVVNAVAWRPEGEGQRALFVSAGDDHTIRVWQAPDAAVLPASVTDRLDPSTMKWW